MSSADVPKADPTYYVTQVAFSTLVEGDEIRGRGTVVPEACVPGTDAVRTSVVLLWADVLAGAAAGLAINPRIPSPSTSRSWCGARSRPAPTCTPRRGWCAPGGRSW